MDETGISMFPKNAFKLTAKSGGWGGGRERLVCKHSVRRLRAAGHSRVSFQRFCYVTVEMEFARKRTCGELRSAAPVVTPYVTSDTVYTVNTDGALSAMATPS